MALDPPETRPDAVAAIGARVARLSTGGRAALRRLFLTHSNAAIGVVTGLLIEAGVPEPAWRGDIQFARWQLLAHVAAVLSGTGAVDPHQPGRAFAPGRRLQEAGYSELRLLRLTSARGPALQDQIVRAARVLAASGIVPVDLRTLHALTDPNAARADDARLQLARAYYAAEYENEKRKFAS